MNDSQKYEALRKRQDEGEKIAIVSFSHDMSDSWYDVKWPSEEFSREYDSHKAIEKMANRLSLAIVWVGDQQYNPWARKN